MNEKCYIRPPLSEKLFPVYRVGRIIAIREGEIFFPFSLMHKLGYTGNKPKINNFETWKKIF